VAIASEGAREKSRSRSRWRFASASVANSDGLARALFSLVSVPQTPVPLELSSPDLSAAPRPGIAVPGDLSPWGLSRGVCP